MQKLTKQSMTSTTTHTSFDTPLHDEKQHSQTAETAYEMAMEEEEEPTVEEPPAEEPETTCRNCGRNGFCTRREVLSLRVAGYTFRASMTVLHCVSCGQSQWSPQMASRFRLQIASWLAKKGVQSGHAFKFMRKALGLKAVELSRLLSLAPETVSRWERGHRPCDTKALTILGTMVMDRLSGHDTTMERLYALQSPPPETTPVDLTDVLRQPILI